MWGFLVYDGMRSGRVESLNDFVHTPVLIIGSGLAGLSAAYSLAQRGVECTVVTKATDVELGTNTLYAQGGIVSRPDGDSPKALADDILKAGAGINSLEAVQQMCAEGVDLVQQVLIDDLHIPFDTVEGSFSYTQEAAHQVPRILHVKDHTGKTIMEFLKRATADHPKIRFLSSHVLVDVLTTAHHCTGYEMKYEQNWCIGAYLYDLQSQQVQTVTARYTLLATGGIGQLYQFHTNAEHAYGSGLAVANRAGVRVINAHFVQFHPTALWTADSGRRFLISEALRGEGARLMNHEGELLMDAYEKKDLESRAIISRALAEELEKSGEEHVYLNIADYYTGSVALSERFPAIYQQCLMKGIDISKDPIPVVPAEHFFCGGIKVGKHGHTELPGLFAVGEVSCTGVHGANRLASTSLLECLTWGTKSGETIAGLVQDAESKSPGYLEKAFALVKPWESFGTAIADPELVAREKDQIRKLMWSHVGILRTEEKLIEARDELRKRWGVVHELYTTHALSEDLLELRHMVEAAYLIAHSAASYTNIQDSLGGHVLRD